MKNLIYVAFLGILLWSCESPSYEGSGSLGDSLLYIRYDSALYQELLEQEDTIRELREKLDIMSDEKSAKSIPEDTLDDANKTHKRPLGLSSLDTTTVLPELRENYKKIIMHQMIMDSLIKRGN